jgi:vacuolar-type H+-ATPase subunit I/STV1
MTQSIQITKLEGGFPVQAPLATDSSVMSSVQDNTVHVPSHVGGYMFSKEEQEELKEEQEELEEEPEELEELEEEPKEELEEEPEEPEELEELDEEDEEDDDEDTASVDTVTMLGKDPLFLVLSKFLMNENGNIVDILEKINKNLENLANMITSIKQPQNNST